MVLHLVAVAKNGGIFHTIRKTDGTWVPFTNVAAAVLSSHPGTLNPGMLQDVTCAGVGNDLQVCGLTPSGDVVHAIRNISGPWTQFGDLLAAAQAPGGPVFSVGATGFNNQLRVCLALQKRSGQIVSIDQELFQTIRNSTGAWKPMAAVGGSFSDVACSSVNGHLHFCGTTFDSSGVHMNVLQHAIENPPGVFTSFGDVRAVVLGENPGSFDPGVFHLVSCAGDGGSLHVCTISSGRLFHTIRRLDGTWFPFGDVVGVVAGSNPGSPRPLNLGSISCALVKGELHVVSVDGAGTVWHTIRRSDGTWFPFGNVTLVVGGANAATVPGPVDRVDVADSL